MKYLVTKSIVEVIGKIWMPSTVMAMRYDLSLGLEVQAIKDLDGAFRVNRESVEAWLATHAGDFASITDFYASIEDGPDTIEIPWADEESEMIFNDCMFCGEDE